MDAALTACRSGQAIVTWDLDVRRALVEDATVFALSGRLGQLGAGHLIERLVADVPAGTTVVLDLSGVDYASSAGLTALDAIAGRVIAGGGRLVLCGLSEPVRLAFDLAGMLPHFTIVDSVQAAVASPARMR